MPVANQKAPSAVAVMKPEVKNDSLDTFIKQAIGKEPSLSYSRTGDSPIQWIQLLHALDQQDLPGWPLLSPVKMQLQKCGKCSLEFCSTINYRRHIRLHRRSLNLDRDSSNETRELLKEFWDKLTFEEAVEIVSFKDVALEEVPGHSIVKALTSFVGKPGFSSLPPACMKAGAALLDIVQSRPSRFPVTSVELFSILDEASENTFLCAGKAESLQKYVFDGEAGKIGLEMRNLIACTSFLIEQKLVKAWLADKDAESLRYQQLLVEEEEAAQKRQAELLERKRRKKLRQQEQRAKAEDADPQGDSAGTSDSSAQSPSTSSPIDQSISTIPDLLRDSISSSFELNQRPIDEDSESNEMLSGRDSGFSEGNSHVVEHKALRRNKWHAQRFQRGSSGFHAGQSHQGKKLSTLQKHAYHRDSRSTSSNNANKVWTPKQKPENDAQSCITRLHTDEARVTDQSKNLEVLIGSISVAIGNNISQPQGEQLGTVGSSDTDSPATSCSIKEKPAKPDNRSVAKLWRPVSRHDNGAGVSVQNGHDNSDTESHGCNGSDELHRSRTDVSISDGHGSSPALAVENGQLGTFRFSSCAVEAFLAQRWREAIASDHTELVVISGTEPPGCTELQDEWTDCYSC